MMAFRISGAIRNVKLLKELPRPKLKLAPVVSDKAKKREKICRACEELDASSPGFERCTSASAGCRLSIRRYTPWEHLPHCDKWK